MFWHYLTCVSNVFHETAIPPIKFFETARSDHHGWIAANQNVQDHPHTPHIYRLIVGNVLEDFGCHICGSYCEEE